MRIFVEQKNFQYFPSIFRMFPFSNPPFCRLHIFLFIFVPSKCSGAKLTSLYPIRGLWTLLAALLQPCSVICAENVCFPVFHEKEKGGVIELRLHLMLLFATFKKIYRRRFFFLLLFKIHLLENEKTFLHFDMLLPSFFVRCIFWGKTISGLVI